MRCAGSRRNTHYRHSGRPQHAVVAGHLPMHLLPYLARAFSVDRWDRNWPEETKRQVIRDAWLIHRHKGDHLRTAPGH